MKLILNESQYNSVLEKIKSLEDEVKSLKTNLMNMIKNKIFDYLDSNYDAKGGKYNYGNTTVFFILPDYIENALLKKNIKNSFLSISFNLVNNQYIEVSIYWDSNIKEKADPEENKIQWNYNDNEEELNRFVNKINQTIDRRLSKENLNKIIGKLK
jgi:hypothetical protein